MPLVALLFLIFLSSGRNQQIVTPKSRHRRRQRQKCGKVSWESRCHGVEYECRLTEWPHRSIFVLLRRAAVSNTRTCEEVLNTMPPQMSKYGAADGEHVPLSTNDDEGGPHHVEPMEYKSLSSFGASNADEEDQKKRRQAVIIAGAAVAIAGLIAINASVAKSLNGRLPIGPYELSSVQEGATFFDNYEFYDGPDSLGSAGYNDYVSKKRATELNIANITKEDGETFVYMSSASTEKGPRESVRLEGKTRYDRGLFILDLRHMPAGCGVWPAWWLTDEAAWPDNGEIDIIEGINYQTVAKTALHTSDRCSMFAHVPAWAKTGEWDRASKYMHGLFRLIIY